MTTESGNKEPDRPHPGHEHEPPKTPHLKPRRPDRDWPIKLITWATPILLGWQTCARISARNAEMAASRAREAAAQLESQRKPLHVPSDCRIIPPGERCPDGEMTRIHFMVQECCGNSRNRPTF